MLGIIGGARTGLVIVGLMVAMFLVLGGVQTGIIRTTANGRPLDMAGDTEACPRCNKWGAVRVERYDYTCDHCGHKCTIRLHGTMIETNDR